MAYDKGQTARISCRMQAYPKPRFDWAFANSVLQNRASGPYSMNSTALGDDVYESVLTIRDIDHSSYGDYTCKSGKLPNYAINHIACQVFHGHKMFRTVCSGSTL